MDIFYDDDVVFLFYRVVLKVEDYNNIYIYINFFVK